MENKDFKCLHRKKEKVSKTVFLRRGQNLFLHLSYPSIHLPVVEHPSGEPTTIWSCTIIHVWMQEEKMVWVILDSSEFVTGIFACFPEDKITDKSYRDRSCTHALLGKANFLISTPHSHATCLAVCGIHRSPLWRGSGRESWSFEHESCKLSTGK